jgi:hypothetical protein
MPSQSGERRIPYGRIEAGDAGPEQSVAPGAKLRLSHGPYPFAEPPDLVRATSVEDQLDLVREHLASLCGPWDRLAGLFLDAYFEWIAASIEGAASDLRASAARLGGLFAPRDWSFAALRPLPQAHLPAGEGSVRADFAFWSGASFIALDLQGSSAPRRQRKEELARLASAGTALVAVPGAALQQERAGLLARILPAEMQRFWTDVALPSGPFGPDYADGLSLPP